MHPEFFYTVMALLVIVAIASVPGDNEVTQMARGVVGFVFTAFAVLLGGLGLFSAGLAGILAFGLLGWLAVVIALLALSRFRLSLNFAAAALVLFALMLAVV